MGSTFRDAIVTNDLPRKHRHEWRRNTQRKTAGESSPRSGKRRDLPGFLWQLGKRLPIADPQLWYSGSNRKQATDRDNAQTSHRKEHNEKYIRSLEYVITGGMTAKPHSSVPGTSS